MKKIICMICLLLILSLTLTGCTFLSFLNRTKLASYSKDVGPSQVIKTEKYWVSLINEYGKSDYSISVSDTSEKLVGIYSVEDVGIWYFEANDNGVVWCESSEESYSYKFYGFSDKEVKTIHEAPKSAGYQPQNVGIFLDKVYFTFIDYENQTINVCEYEIETESINVFDSYEWVLDKIPYPISVENGYLSFAYSEYIKVINLNTEEVVFKADLPENSRKVFAVSYDSINDTCALYYADADSEDIGIFKEEDSAIRSVFTFEKNIYAYEDKIRCVDGHIYWIEQINYSGYITDHYQLIDYSYFDGKKTETKRTFYFNCNEHGMYLLRFNRRGDYTGVELYELSDEVEWKTRFGI